MDLRTLESMLQKLDERMTRHEMDCMQERRLATEQRSAVLESIMRVQISTLVSIVLILISALGAVTTKALAWW